MTLKKREEFCRWTSPKKTGQSGEERTASRLIAPIFFPEVNISKNEKIFCIGSCFAREIEDAFVRLGFDHVESLNLPIISETKNRGIFNLYSLQNINFELDLAMEGGNWLETLDIGFDEYVDPLLGRQHIGHNIEEAGIIRKDITDTFRRIRDCRVIVVTLGLVETWFDRRQNAPLSQLPSPKEMAKDPERFVFRRFDAGEANTLLDNMYAKIKALRENRDFDLILTVSPVPLWTTFTGGDIIVENAYSKATLRSAATNFVSRYDNVHYYPSYEMATLSQHAIVWSADQCHLNSTFVDFIVYKFISKCCDDEETRQQAQKKIDQSEAYFRNVIGKPERLQELVESRNQEIAELKEKLQLLTRG